MIVADTSLIAYLLIAGPFTDAAQRVLKRDNDWVAPPIWHHEFLNVLATSLRRNVLEEKEAMRILAEAEQDVRTQDHELDWDAVKLSIQTRVGTYECEFIVLARRLGIPLITGDKAVLKTFPETAVSLDQYAAGS
jgi:predicted nucleic acid-binding protein